MTAIVGIVGKKYIYIGADSLAVSNLSTIARADAKVFINGPYIIGFTTSWRMGQLLQYEFNHISHPLKMDDHRFMVTRFVPVIKKCLETGGFVGGGDFLVGYRKKLYTIGSDFQVGMPLDNFAAIGCGLDLCLGSLHTTKEYKIEPEDKVLLALKAAEYFNSGVRGPFVIKKQKIRR